MQVRDLSIDAVPLTVDTLGTLAGHLEEALDEFAAWGLAVQANGRLPRIHQLLVQTFEAGQYPKDDDELIEVGSAVQVAQEFVEIANTLPDSPIASVKEDLRIALRGTTAWRPVNKAHLQRQSQLWVGAMMVQGGAPTGVLQRTTGPNPDFELEEGSMKYAVEVKRPESIANAQALVSGAAKQIRNGRYHGGSIVVDLTDCIDIPLACAVDSGEPDSSALNKELTSALRDLHRQIFDDSASRLRQRRDHVFSLVGFARHVFWNRNDLTVPRLGRAVATVEYQRGGPNTLKARRAKWLGRLVHLGITGSGHAEMGEMSITDLLE